MGLLDITSKVITEYKADISDHKAKVRELAGEEKRLAQEQLKAAEDRNKGLEGWIDKLGKTGLALNAVGMALNVAKDSWKTYADHIRLTAAAGSVDMERLRKASLGLRTEHELLEFAAKAQHGAFKLTQEQMEMVQRAMVGLTRAGFDQEEVTKKVTDAIVKLEGDGLKDFGVRVRQGSSDTEKFNNVMAALAEKAMGVDSSTANASEGIDRMGVSMQDSFDKMKVALGQLVQSMAPLLEALATAVSLTAQIASAAMSDFDFQGMSAKMLGGSKSDVWGPDFDPMSVFRDAKFFGAGENEVPRDFWESGSSLDQAKFLTFVQTMKDRQKRGKATDVSQLVGIGGFDSIGSGAFSGTLGSTAGISVDDRAILDQIEKLRTDTLTADWQKRLGEQQAKKTTFLESTFGKLEDFNAYATAFQMLSGSVSAGLNAWIDGSMSAGEAVKKFIAEALKGLASQMAIESLKHGAYAIGSLAFGDVRGAGQHAAAAAAFGAGAAAAAVAAKAMGGGGANVPQASAGGGGVSAGGAGSRDHRTAQSGGGGQNTYVIVYGEHFYSESNRMRQLDAQRFIETAVNSYAEHS